MTGREFFILIMTVVILIVGITVLTMFTGNGDSGDQIIQQRYEKCIAAGGNYKQGDGLDDFSCVITKP